MRFRLLTECSLWARPATNIVQARAFSTSVSCQKDVQQDTRIPTGPRWLSETKARIGKCITFGMSPELVDKAGKIAQEICTDWRELTAGTEGYLTDPKRAGLYKQAVVWGEQDSMGHVNNVMYVRYAESGRTNWAKNIGQYYDLPNRQQWVDLLSSKGTGLILKSITIDFKFPMKWPDRISVYHKLRERPDESTRSLVLDVLVLSEAKQRPAARCLEDVVVYDYKKASKGTLPAFMLRQFQQIWDLQEHASRVNHAKVKDIEARVTELEQHSWNRPDAKEDFGSAA